MVGESLPLGAMRNPAKGARAIPTGFVIALPILCQKRLGRVEIARASAGHSRTPCKRSILLPI